MGGLPWYDLAVLLVLALLIFGPKKLMEMGSSFGKAFREFREATKEMNWSNLMSTGSTEEPTRPPQVLQALYLKGNQRSTGISRQQRVQTDG